MRLTRRGLLRLVGAAALAPFLPLPAVQAPPVYFLDAELGPMLLSGGAVGGIDRASFSFWRNQQASTPHNSDAFAADMRNVYEQCTR